MMLRTLDHGRFIHSNIYVIVIDFIVCIGYFPPFKNLDSQKNHNKIVILPFLQVTKITKDARITDYICKEEIVSINALVISVITTYTRNMYYLCFKTQPFEYHEKTK